MAGGVRPEITKMAEERRSIVLEIFIAGAGSAAADVQVLHDEP